VIGRTAIARPHRHVLGRHVLGRHVLGRTAMC
jgi:hypothetical protein